MDDHTEKSDQVFLILQGPLSSFYSEIAGYLTSGQCEVIKVHLCGNDVIDWHHSGALWFRNKPSAFDDFLENEIIPRNITHLLLHGDRRSYHQTAIKWAKRHGIEVIATELGYLRPDWMTLERGACSTSSHFPSDAASIRSIAQKVDDYDKEIIYRDSTFDLIAQELRFTVFNCLFSPLFPHYQSHRPKGPLHVYSGWLMSKLRAKKAQAEGEMALAQITAKKEPYFVFALQLETDFQLRDHSPFSTLNDALTYVMTSFADHAPNQTKLAVKLHPHEFNQKNLTRTIDALTNHLNLSERVVVMEGVSLPALCDEAAGFVTINSSGGFEALSVDCPTICVMPTLYDCAGLTFQGELDAFWRKPEKPDKTLYDDLCKSIAATIQVRGTLYNRKGRTMAAKAVATKLMEETVNQPEAYIARPPRLEKATRMGVTYD